MARHEHRPPLHFASGELCQHCGRIGQPMLPMDVSGGVKASAQLATSGNEWSYWRFRSLE